ncbi:hypothetical protein CRM22_010612 [Opisthorchis felineus]|uniref:Iron-binding zinc finger CDGSH type domain-containing protein n=1 Tax=Opisthorchis felineus TaxID=147828 RepID=A0A4S2KRZ3_OPIFE|nr:hypothetical protein CRM22_010612 [Opisthorchis felineus]
MLTVPLLARQPHTYFLLIPHCSGRYMPPGTLFRQHHERFDENCEPLPRPHPETPRFRGVLDPEVKPKGLIADKRPFRMVCLPNRIYWWCSCGHSQTQPFCDGNHVRIIGQTPHFQINKFEYRPVRMTFKEKTEVWWCTCKQTNEPPYCDGSHNCAEVQAAIKS